MGYSDSKHKKISLAVSPGAACPAGAALPPAKIARFLILSNKFTSYRFFRCDPLPPTFSPEGGGGKVVRLRSKARRLHLRRWGRRASHG
jgi:hypothetical protein